MEENQTESFEQLLESYSKGMNEDLRVGDKLRGKIISIGRESVFIDTGTRIDGIIDRSELMDENRELPYKEGDIIDLYVLSNNGNEIRLSKLFSGTGNIILIEEAYHKSVPVEGKVRSECKGGFQVEVMGRRAFCPISQMDVKYVEEANRYIGETFPFLIIQFDDEGKNIVISRRRLLEKEIEKQKDAFLGEIEIGSQCEGMVTNLMPYGAFVELIPGIEGMIHLSEISWSRTRRPEDVLKRGDMVTVKIIGIEDGKNPGEKKLSLSMKQVTGDPWNNIETLFRIGDKIKGKVTKCANFGAFVEIAPGIEGLVHLSEMSYRKRVLKAEDMVETGDVIDVMVKEIDVGNRRVSLSMKDAEGDPWIDISERYEAGKTVRGIIEKKEKFGYFITLEPGITGLLPMSSIRNLSGSSSLDKAGPGETIPVIIERINIEERKISLAPGDPGDESDWKDYANDSSVSVGSLGHKLREAFMTKKKPG